MWSEHERFRRQMYDIYLGGLDIEKFPRLFKRAIPFRMNIKLEDFVKEYICMEQDMHIEELQESVMQYGRMRGKIEETMEEIGYLQEIRGSYRQYEEKQEETASCTYQISRLEILHLQSKMQELNDPDERDTDRDCGTGSEKSQSGERAGRTSERIRSK